jgi:hypothetical protein
MAGGSAAIRCAGGAISVTRRPGHRRGVPVRDTGVARGLTRLDTAAMNLFPTELSQAVAPGAYGVVLIDTQQAIVDLDQVAAFAFPRSKKDFRCMTALIWVNAAEI